MKLNVPYVKQFNGYACFPACIKMVLRFYKDDIDQRKIYYQSRIKDPLNKNKTLGCWDATIMLSMKKKHYFMKGWIDHNKKVALSKTAKTIFKEYKPKLEKAKRLGLIKIYKNGDIKLIKNLIEAKTPVMIEVHSSTWFKDKNTDPEGTHVVVIVGYTKKGFIINDPAMPYHKRKGKDIWVELGHFKRSCKPTLTIKIVCAYCYQNTK